jgi:tetratricopeptide (TPR) repeat protein
LSIALLLALVTLAVYSPVRQFAYLNFDDPDYVAQNPLIQRGLDRETMKLAFTRTHSFNWHPLTTLSHMLDCRLFGANPGAHHLVNVAFHAASTLLLFTLLRRTTGDLWPSAFVAAVFALHPLHVESVAWISERKDVLSTFFWLLTTHAYVRFAERSDRGGNRAMLFYAAALLLYALGLMSKAMLVTLPATLLLLDFWPLGRLSAARFSRLLLEKLPFLVLAVASGLVTLLVQRSTGAVRDMQSFSIGLRLANVFVSYVRYLGKAFWPEGLMIFYPYPEAWEGRKVAAAVLIVAAASLFAVWKARRLPFVFVGWSWFVGTLVPVIGLVQVGLQSMADRYMYVPLIGLSIIVAWGVESAARSPRWGQLVRAGVFGAATVACLILTRQQLRHWKDSVTAFEHALSVLPDHVMAHAMAGNAYNERGDPAKAMWHYGEALRLNPGFAEVQYNVGNLLLAQNRLDEAIASYERALELRPTLVDARANLAVALNAQRRYAEALAHNVEALRQRPDDPTLLRNMALNLAELGRFDEAERELVRAIHVKPDDPVAHLLLGDVLTAMGRLPEAAEQYRKALALSPGLVEAKLGLDHALGRQ